MGSGLKPGKCRRTIFSPGLIDMLRRFRVLFNRMRLRALVRRRVPQPVLEVLRGLEAAGHQAFLVGGCVRDLLLGRTPTDWDVTTSAPAEEVLGMFPRTHPTGIRHGTVLVLAGEHDGAHKLEVTTFRGQAGGVEEDLLARDFTIGALGLDLRGSLIDPAGGLTDLMAGIVRGTADPEKRLSEDPLRTMRAIRIAAQLRFRIEPATFEGVCRISPRLPEVAIERIRDELSKALISPWPGFALGQFWQAGILNVILPELLEGVGMEQNRHHAHTVWEHTLIATSQIPPVLHLRLAALFHDIAKPRCLSVEGGDRHFYNHETVGADLTRQILRRLRFDLDTVHRVVHLVRHHMSLHLDPVMSDAAIRRMLVRVGRENIPDLLELRRADRIASGKKEGDLSAGTIHILEKMKRILQEEQAMGLKDLALDGLDVMAVAKVPAGPMVGVILNQLLAEVSEEPSRNYREYLERRIAELVRED